jgi:uncharacterized ion transporter superfamily protein YfcC
MYLLFLPLSFLIPSSSSSGLATVAMPITAPPLLAILAGLTIVVLAAGAYLA